jgi:hypothetical protein
MFGMKTLVVGGGAAALLWIMHSHASAGDVVSGVTSGVQNVQTGTQAVQSGTQSLQTGIQSLLGTTTSGTGTTGSLLLDNSGQGGANIILSPNSARPGQTVTISAPSCVQSASGTAQSSVFTNNGSVSLTRNPQAPGGLIGTTMIASNALNGQWSVNVQCGSVNATTYITVFGGFSPTTNPSRPPKAGGGGSVVKGDLGMTAGGAALVAGGVAYGAWALRRRSTTGTHAG